MSQVMETVTYVERKDDQDIAIEIEWQVDYRVDQVAGNCELEIVDYSLVEVRAELMDGRFFPVATQDVDTSAKQVAESLWACVDGADVIEACWDHFDRL